MIRIYQTPIAEVEYVQVQVYLIREVQSSFTN